MLKIQPFLKHKSCTSLCSSFSDISPRAPAPTVLTTPANLPYFISSLIKKQGFYVNRLAWAERILKSDHSIMRFSGPDRFGKTTFLQLLHYCYTEQWERVKSTALGNLEHMKTAPAYHTTMLNFSELRTSDPAKLETDLLGMVREIKHYDEHRLSVKAAMGSVISALERSGLDISILIDDWDYPLQTEDPALFHANLKLLEQFFAPLAKHNRSKVVLAGTFNASRTEHQIYDKIRDISTDPELAPRLGFTEEEVRAIFAKEASPELTITDESAFVSNLEKHYGGFVLSPGNPTLKVYNPFSVAQCKKTAGIVGQYWLNAEMLQDLKSIISDFPYYLDPEEMEVEYDINSQEARLDSKLLSSDSSQVVRFF